MIRKQAKFLNTKNKCSTKKNPGQPLYDELRAKQRFHKVNFGNGWINSPICLY